MRLLDVATGRTTDLDPVEGSIDGIFALEDQVSGAVATSLGLTLSSPESARPTSSEAYECFVRARRLLDRLSKGAVDQARDLLDRAVAMDHDYVPALAAMANAYCFRAIATANPEDLDRALHFADRAMQIDPLNAEAYIWRGYALTGQRRFAEAASAYRRAIELDSTNAMSHYFAGGIQSLQGRAGEGLPLLQRAVTTDFLADGRIKI